MICPHCQSNNREEAIFCRACGKKLLYQCWNCGGTMSLDSKFYDECGSKLKEFKEYNKMVKDFSRLTLPQAKKEFERLFIEQKLRACKGNITATAKALGVERSNLHKKLKIMKTIKRKRGKEEQLKLGYMK